MLVWRLRLGRVPVRVVFDQMGMDLDSLLCLCCQDAIESIDNCFGRCKWVEMGWKKIFKWWRLGNFNGSSIEDILMHEGHSRFSSKQQRVWQAVI